MADSPRSSHGRIAGTPNRDKAELRALVQERVHEFTVLRREADVRAGLPESELQPVIEDYDPVVQLAIFAVDRRSTKDQQMKAASEVAQYLRAKLKSIEMTQDPEGLETLSQRQELTSRLVGLLEMAAAGKKGDQP